MEQSNFQLSKIINIHRGWITALDIDPTNNILASASTDTSIKFTSMVSSKLLLTFSGHVLPVEDIVFHQNHPFLFSCSSDKKIKCYDLISNKNIKDYYGHLSSVNCIDTNMDELVSGSSDSSVRLWDLRSKKNEGILTGHTGIIKKVKFSNNEIVSCSMDSTIRIWDKRYYKKILTHHRQGVRSFKILNENMISVSDDAIIRYDTDSWSLNNRFKIEEDNEYNTVDIDTSGICYVGTGKGKIMVYDLETGDVKSDIDVRGGICSLVLDKSEELIFCGGTDNSLQVLRRKSDEQ